MFTTVMPRKRTTVTLDVEVIDAIGRVAKRDNISLSRCVENILIEKAKELAEIPADYEPLGETRGGDRTSGDNGDG